jgi:hypothetical protein
MGLKALIRGLGVGGIKSKRKKKRKSKIVGITVKGLGVGGRKSKQMCQKLNHVIR